MVKVKVFEVMARQGIRTRVELARTVGLTEANMGKIVNGDIKAIRLDTINALCRVLDCQPGDLFEYVPDRPKRRAKKAKR